MEVTDPFRVADDVQMPFLKAALEPEQAEMEIRKSLASARDIDFALSAIRVRRYKPGRRCLIEYELRSKTGGSITFLGKSRMKGTDHKTFRIVRALWEGGFGSEASDGISVPEPLGIVPAFNMWLQAKVDGESATDLFARSASALLACRIAKAAHKLHSTPAVTSRHHTIENELAILRDRFQKLKLLRPDWTGRLERLQLGCERLGLSIAPCNPVGIHRDFYSDHILEAGTRLWMLDLDLYSLGDPALDIGNFIAHIIEQRLRMSGDAAPLRHIEQALEDRYVELSGNEIHSSIGAYTTLSLARHVYISTLFPSRQQFTEALFDFCEQRLAATH